MFYYFDTKVNSPGLHKPLEKCGVFFSFINALATMTTFTGKLYKPGKHVYTLSKVFSWPLTVGCMKQTMVNPLTFHPLNSRGRNTGTLKFTLHLL